MPLWYIVLDMSSCYGPIIWTIVLICIINCSVLRLLRRQDGRGKPTESLDKSEWWQKLDAEDTQKYNPNYGYEPYWPGGDWVFKTTTPKGGSTTKPPMVCGEECLPVYREIGKVCTHRVNDTYQIDGCGTWHLFGGCPGNTLDNQSRGYKTFDTYCQFLGDQCRRKPEEKLLFVHIGECVENQESYYRPLNTADQMVDRMKKYLANLTLYDIKKP